MAAGLAAGLEGAAVAKQQLAEAMAAQTKAAAERKAKGRAQLAELKPLPPPFSLAEAPQDTAGHRTPAAGSWPRRRRPASVLQAPEGGKGACLLYTSPSPRDQRGSRMPSSA